MNRSARRKMLRVVGIIMVVMLPVMLALWFAQLRAVSETSAQLRTFAELALDKTELVIQQVDLARDEAEKYQGKLCTPEHRQYMLNVVRGRLFVADLIYAEGQNFLCSTVFTPDQPYAIPIANYTRKPDIAIYYFICFFLLLSQTECKVKHFRNMFQIFKVLKSELFYSVLFCHQLYQHQQRR
jgi:sensor c-di-GMP phosphodiesterase-like protein